MAHLLPHPLPPIAIVVSSQAGPASGIRQKFSTAACDSERHTKTSPRNTLSLFGLSRGDTVAINLPLAAEGARLASEIQRAAASTQRCTVRVQTMPRQQALDELLNDLAEYRSASALFRSYWRKLALHDIRRSRRDYLIPERAAFLAAVERQQSRRAAA